MEMVDGLGDKAINAKSIIARHNAKRNLLGNMTSLLVFGHERALIVPRARNASNAVGLKILDLVLPAIDGPKVNPRETGTFRRVTTLANRFD
jgi:hypothetical protein